MSALLGHADAARCMARAFDEEADRQSERMGGVERAALLFSIGRAYDRAAVLMLEENRRQLGASSGRPPGPPPPCKGK